MININSSEQSIFIAVLVCAIATFATRALPFMLVSAKKPSATLDAIERHMGVMIMVLLVFYSLRQSEFSHYPYAMPEAAGVLSALIIHLAFKNALLSIIISTALYIVISRLL